MKSDLSRKWIWFLVLVVAWRVTPPPVDAFVMSLDGGGLHDPEAIRSSAADVLYATDRDGREVKLLGTDSSLDDGTPLDLGLPSVGPDGTVFFGAAFRRNNQVRWEILAANPDTHSLSRVAPSSSDWALEMVTDPTPLAQSDGSIVFAAREGAHGEGIYHLKNGRLSCLVRVGANLEGNNVLRNIAFGSFSAAHGGAVGFTGYLTPAGKAEVLVSDGKVKVLAAVGGKSPDGARYRDLGPPAVSGGARGDVVAFPAVTDRGSGVYVYIEGNLGAMLTTGSSCAAGKITYILQDRVGINSEGTVVVAASCSGLPSIFVVKGSRATMVVNATRKPNRTGFAELSTPSLLDNGTVLFVAGKADRANGLYSVHAGLGSSAMIGAVLPLIPEPDPIAPPLHSILNVSVTSNEHGRLAYLGGPIVSFASVPSEMNRNDDGP